MVLVTVTAIFLSIIVDIEWDLMRLAVSVNFSTGVTVPVLFLSDKRSTNTEWFLLSFVVLLHCCG